MNPTKTLKFSCLVTSLLVPSTFLSKADIPTEELPALHGTTFGRAISVTTGPGVTRSFAYLFNFHDGSLTTYIWDQKASTLGTHSETGTYGYSEYMVGDTKHWSVYFVEAAKTADFTKSSADTLVVNVDFINIDTGANDIATMSILSDSCISWGCLGCLSWPGSGCCSCCYCVHRCMDLPCFMDRLCCFYSSGGSCPAGC